MDRLRRQVAIALLALRDDLQEFPSGRQDTFFCEDDYGAYVELVAGRCREEGVAIWAYCLMPNHVHLIAVPEDQLQQMRNHGRTGRPLGDATFLERLEGVVGRVLRPRKPGRKPIFPKSP